MKKEGIGKRSQVTLFIIVAIIIVTAVLVFFIYVKPTFIDNRSGKVGFEGCIEKEIEKSVNEIGLQGGFVNPDFYYLYNDEKISYLCYTNLYYKPCVNQKPFLRQHFEENLKLAAKVGADNCFDNALTELRNQGYQVVGQTGDLDITLDYGKITAGYDAPVVLTTAEGGQRFTKFNFEIKSHIYEMLMVATSIIQFETSYGDSDVSTLMTYYPNLKIQKLKQSDGSTIYIIEDKESGTKFQFASRSYAWPAGYGLT